ncbi:fluoride efflux transporter CrcB [Neobacillus sp. CF12]|uniref:fluoride efflux transporter CrcB n=1 Tax=Neobacillus sp. CF12 TaxID=3055864 RepID=UPI0025A16B5C|nr:fluoride efflux transporter CrcB [Neobacillus sp. CF12]MDM5326602.1 fluoride efflux transporter CrcB [Neobacillus sp. CF12]
MIWLVGIGGSLGAAARYLLGSLINRRKNFDRFPLGTWVINISGSFFLGLLAQLHLANDISEWLWFLVGVGFCGAYTTFSTFGYETITLLHSNKKILAGIYVLASVVVSTLMAALGLYL